MGIQKPGEKPAKPGEYLEVGSRGGEVKNPRKVTIEKGDTPLPPTQEPNRGWISEERNLIFPTGRTYCRWTDKKGTTETLK